jgi:hypothetical protein
MDALAVAKSENLKKLMNLALKATGLVQLMQPADAVPFTYVLRCLAALPMAEGGVVSVKPLCKPAAPAPLPTSEDTNEAGLVVKMAELSSPIVSEAPSPPIIEIAIR